MHTAATEAAVTAAETALRSTADASAVHGAAETAVRSASEASAMHTSAEAGLAAEGVLVDHATVVESTECAGVAAPSTCGAANPRSARWSKVSRESPRRDPENRPEHPESQGIYSGPVVKKGMAPGEKPSVVKNYEPIVPVAAPEIPAPGKGEKSRWDNQHRTTHNRANEETSK